ncbi:hypothetical protein LCGC14_0542510 [marine sediment metagenome]|uniref:Uncharacterized protein n=1 Tax=marine sediment metagenome TaxID=412755 RepID=A0A0F9UDU4_9ZZZZ
MIETPEKTCNRCKLTKALAEFYKHKLTKDGLLGQCKECVGKACKVYHKTHQTERAASRKIYCLAHKTEKAAYDKIYNAEHRTEQATYHRIWMVEHRTEQAVKGKIYRDEHQAEIMAQKRAYHATLHYYLHNRWRAMVHRCMNPKNQDYNRYGGAGIQCLFTFESFFTHVTEDLGFISVEMLVGLDIHRINDGDYCVGGIDFLTHTEHMALHKVMRKTER